MIRIAEPVFLGRELEYVSDVMLSKQLSMGKYVRQFGEQLALKSSARFAVPVASGTAALHSALLALGIQPGDSVLMPSCSYIATANAVRYCGANPVFLDVDSRTWTLNPMDVRDAVKLFPRVVGVITVNLFGVPCELPKVDSIWILEDACESPGVPLRGDAAVLSFYGNKIITCGEGGAVLTNSPSLAREVELVRGQGTTGVKRYVHEVLGFNYRMTDLQAAVGLAQLEQLEQHLQRRRMLRRAYERLLPVQVRKQERTEGSVDWVMPILVQRRDSVARMLEEEFEIETRPIFPPLHTQPGYGDEERLGSLPVACDLAEKGLLLPLHLGMSLSDVAWICQSLKTSAEKAA